MPADFFLSWESENPQELFVKNQVLQAVFPYDQGPIICSGIRQAGGPAGYWNDPPVKVFKYEKNGH